MAAAVLLLLVVSLHRKPLPRSTMHLLLTWFVVAGLYFGPAMTQEHVYLRYLVGDFATVVFPAVLLALGGQVPRLFSDEASHRWLCGLGLVAAVVAFAFADDEGGVVRYEAPGVFVTTMSWIVLHTSRSWLTRTAAAIPVLGLLFLSFRSGFRTSTILWFVSGVVIGTMVHGVRRVGGTLACMGLGLVVLGYGAGLVRPDSLGDVLGHSRFRPWLRGEVDASFAARLEEAQDALSQVDRAWPAVQYLFGYGHGATYTPMVSYVERNVTRDGVVHNIHVGPVLLFFRYGLFGLGVYLTLCTWVVREAVRAGRERGSGRPSVPRLVFTSGMLFFLADLLVRNSIVEPTFAYTLAGFLFTASGDRGRAGAPRAHVSLLQRAGA
jgi:hypothetical protein